MEGNTTWTLEVLVLLPLVLLFIALLVIGGFFWWRANREFDTFEKVPAYALWVIAAIALVFVAVGYYPYKAEYHQFVTKVGEVRSIKSRLLGSSDSFQQKFVVEYTDGRQFGCEDTRCALVKPGDKLTLACKRIWQYAGTDGYDCNFISSSRKGETS